MVDEKKDVSVELIKLSTKCQIVIPIKIRNRMGLKEGDQVLLGGIPEKGELKLISDKELIKKFLSEYL